MAGHAQMDVEEEDEKGGKKSKIDKLEKEINDLKVEAKKKEKIAKERERAYEAAFEAKDDAAEGLKTLWLKAEGTFERAEKRLERAEERLNLLIQQDLAANQQGKQEAALAPARVFSPLPIAVAVG